MSEFISAFPEVVGERQAKRFGATVVNSLHKSMARRNFEPQAFGVEDCTVTVELDEDRHLTICVDKVLSEFDLIALEYGDDKQRETFTELQEYISLEDFFEVNMSSIVTSDVSYDVRQVQPEFRRRIYAAGYYLAEDLSNMLTLANSETVNSSLWLDGAFNEHDYRVFDNDEYHIIKRALVENGLVRERAFKKYEASLVDIDSV